MNNDAYPRYRTPARPTVASTKMYPATRPASLTSARCGTTAFATTTQQQHQRGPDRATDRDRDAVDAAVLAGHHRLAADGFTDVTETRVRRIREHLIVNVQRGYRGAERQRGQGPRSECGRVFSYVSILPHPTTNNGPSHVAKASVAKGLKAQNQVGAKT